MLNLPPMKIGKPQPQQQQQPPPQTPRQSGSAQSEIIRDGGSLSPAQKQAGYLQYGTTILPPPQISSRKWMEQFTGPGLDGVKSPSGGQGSSGGEAKKG